MLAHDNALHHIAQLEERGKEFDLDDLLYPSFHRRRLSKTPLSASDMVYCLIGLLQQAPVSVATSMSQELVCVCVCARACARACACACACLGVGIHGHCSPWTDCVRAVRVCVSWKGGSRGTWLAWEGLACFC